MGDAWIARFVEESNRIEGLFDVRPQEVEATKMFVARGHDAWSCDLLPSEDRWRIRSRTFSGIAEAMADQWGGDLSRREAA